MVTDSIADVLTRIRNGQSAGHKVVRVPVSKVAKSILAVLKSEGFIDTFEITKADENAPKNPAQKGRKVFDQITVYLKYYDNGLPVIATAKRVSRPGLRTYASIDKLPKAYSGLGISILSTSQGVMSDREARKRKIGGEVMARIS